MMDENKINFTIDRNGIPQTVLSLSDAGMMYHGQLVKDAGIAYRAFMEWMLRAQKERTTEENARRGLTLATLCDMLLGENAADRSDDALIRRARELLTFWEAHQ